MQKNRKYDVPAALAVSALSFLAFLPALRNGFVNWDDDIYVYENPHVRSLDSDLLKWAFSDFHASNWHPLTWLSHAVDIALWGLNPAGHHLTSIILHAVNVYLVAFLAFRLFDAPKGCPAGREGTGLFGGKRIPITASVTGLLFGLHPLRVESVVWISERKDLLCALFVLGSVILYVKFLEAGNREPARPGSLSAYRDKRYVASIGMFALALLCKPMAATLPAVLLILDWHPFGRFHSLKSARTAFLEKVPFLLLSVLSAMVAYLAQRAGDSLVPMASVPWPTRILVAVHSLASYLGKTIVPLGLLPFYPHPRQVSIRSVDHLLALGLVVGVTALCFGVRKRERIWLAAWGYYVVTLLPVLGILQVGGQSMADRYTYLPALGPSVVLGMYAGKLAGAVETGKGAGRGHPVCYPVVALLLLYVVVLSSLTIRQIGVWRNSVVLWSHVIDKAPEKVPLAYYNRGQAFMDTGQVEMAIRDYTAATVLNPYYHEAFYNRALAYEMTGRPGLAVADYEKAISLNAGNYKAFNNRGVLYGKGGTYDKAIDSFNRSIAINPSYADSHFNRGITYVAVGRTEEALADFDMAIALNPGFAPAHLHRGYLHLGMGRREAAAADFRRACELGIPEACRAASEP